MAKVTVKPYGSWASPISADMLVQKTIALREIGVDGEDLYWVEGHPEEKGRAVLVRRKADGRREEITPKPFYARTRVHEYGGGSFVADRGTVYFSHFLDHRLYQRIPGQEPRPVTAEGPVRYADPVVDRLRRRLIVVREDHRGQRVVNSIVAITTDGDRFGTPLVEGQDFYMFPRLSPDGSQLAWISWNHPLMPWDGTELWLADVTQKGHVTHARRIAGGEHESIFQPEWAPDGTLYFVSDRTNWWNLYRWTGFRVEPVTDLSAEFGLPAWVFGLSTYGFMSDRDLIASYRQDGFSHMVHIDTQTLKMTPIPCPATDISCLKVSSAGALLIASFADRPSAIWHYHDGHFTELRKSSAISLDPPWISRPRPLTFPTENGQTAHAIYYPPANPEFSPPAGEKPPLIVLTHGGPTSQSPAAFRLSTQYWTSRGFAVADVNYGGSTGYGREYRRRLYGRWGVVDVDDVVNAARFLVEQGLADGHRLAIRGGSAGGYTTLAALTFRSVFRTGASYYGVSDLGALAEDTHKFESRYLDQLIGPWPQEKALYRERSPLFHLDRLSRPIIFFQGLDDKVVPPDQTERMVTALKDKGLPVAYLAFPGEGHGFVQAENIKRAQEAELYWYATVLGFPLADTVDPVEITHQDRIGQP